MKRWWWNTHPTPSTCRILRSYVVLWLTIENYIYYSRATEIDAHTFNFDARNWMKNETNTTEKHLITDTHIFASHTGLQQAQRWCTVAASVKCNLANKLFRDCKLLMKTFQLANHSKVILHHIANKKKKKWSKTAKEMQCTEIIEHRFLYICDKR